MTMDLKLAEPRSLPTASRLEIEEAQSLPCYDQPDLWQDTTSLKDLRKARTLCRTVCSHVDWCERERAKTVEDHGVACGVWAGEIYNVHGQLLVEPGPRGCTKTETDSETNAA